MHFKPSYSKWIVKKNQQPSLIEVSTRNSSDTTNLKLHLVTWSQNTPINSNDNFVFPLTNLHTPDAGIIRWCARLGYMIPVALSYIVFKTLSPSVVSADMLASGMLCTLVDYIISIHPSYLVISNTCHACKLHTRGVFLLVGSL